MDILVMGTGGFVVPSLEALVSSDTHRVVALVTMPLRTARKGEKAGIPPVRAVAERLAIPMLEPEDVNSPEGLGVLRKLRYDIIFICDYGKILSPQTIATAPLGGVNLHGSLLPAYRGAAPINRAILNGEKEIGISVIHIEPKVDAGPVVATDSFFPGLDETAVEIERELARRGATLLLSSLDAIAAGTAVALPQNPHAVSKAPKLKKEEGAVVWSNPARKIVNQYRALQPWPKTYTQWVRAAMPDKPVRLIVGPFEEAPIRPEFEDAAPGTVLVATGDTILVRTGDALLRILKLQPSGKSLMTAEAFLRGYRMKPGDVLQ